MVWPFGPARMIGTLPTPPSQAESVSFHLPQLALDCWQSATIGGGGVQVHGLPSNASPAQRKSCRQAPKSEPNWPNPCSTLQAHCATPSGSATAPTAEESSFNKS